MGRLVICPGHAVYCRGDMYADSSWSLLPYQAGEPPFYIEHIAAAAHIASSEPDSLLILSGGQTRAKAGRRSEAEGYRDILLSLHEQVPYALEEYARDSFENVSFSLCRYHELTGALPDHITVAGWAFKQQRFELHARAIGWPAARFSYAGVNNPWDLGKALAGERATLADWAQDPLGEGEKLRSKREQRNPFHREHPYALATIAGATLGG